MARALYFIFRDFLGVSNMAFEVFTKEHEHIDRTLHALSEVDHEDELVFLGRDDQWIFLLLLIFLVSDCLFFTDQVLRVVVNDLAIDLSLSEVVAIKTIEGSLLVFVEVDLGDVRQVLMYELPQFFCGNGRLFVVHAC